MALRTAILYSGSQIGVRRLPWLSLSQVDVHSERVRWPVCARYPQIEGAHGLEGWRWLFIVEGILSKPPRSPLYLVIDRRAL